MPSTHHGILLHIIFSTKNRSKVLHERWRDDLYGYIGGIVRNHDSHLLQVGGIEDHVHLLIRAHPNVSVSDLVQVTKGNSSKWINEDRKINARFAWQRGYGVFSVSRSNVPMVQQYIANQVEHHKSMGFKQEYLELLRRHEIEFDERYVFDEEVVA